MAANLSKRETSSFTLNFCSRVTMLWIWSICRTEIVPRTPLLEQISENVVIVSWLLMFPREIAGVFIPFTKSLNYFMLFSSRGKSCMHNHLEQSVHIAGWTNSGFEAEINSVIQSTGTQWNRRTVQEVREQEQLLLFVHTGHKRSRNTRHSLAMTHRLTDKVHCTVFPVLLWWCSPVDSLKFV